jgi:signal transduction histidine kinase
MMPKVALAQDYNYITSLGLTIMIEMLVIIFIVGMINIVYTHRLVGPVVSRMEQELGGMLKKNEFQHLKLRQKDELKPLVDEINKLIDRARK